MKMQTRINKWKRDRKCAQVVQTGKKLRSLEISRANLTSGYEHLLVDQEYLDQEIVRLKRKHARLINDLKSTA